MPCGVTKNGVVCDNAGTSSHPGMHSGTVSIGWLLGLQKRVFWLNSAAFTVTTQGPLQVGVRIPPTTPPIIPSQAQLEEMVITASGGFSIPSWCNNIDYAILPGGGGGRGGSSGGFGTGASGDGGGAGQWLTGTLVRGTDFAAGTTSGTAIVGDGGNGGAAGASGSAGGASSITVGSTTKTAPGGSGATTTGGALGQSPGNKNYQGISAEGGGTAGLGVPGDEPGGGGGGGAGGGMFQSGSPGQKGGKGRTWLNFRS